MSNVASTSGCRRCSYNIKTVFRKRQSYLLAANFSEYFAYQEVPTTSTIRFRNINLEITLFSLAPPICLSRDGPHANVDSPTCAHYLGATFEKI